MWLFQIKKSIWCCILDTGTKLTYYEQKLFINSYLPNIHISISVGDKQLSMYTCTVTNHMHFTLIQTTKIEVLPSANLLAMLPGYTKGTDQFLAHWSWASSSREFCKRIFKTSATALIQRRK